jgi:stage III sporulation protein AE
MAEMGYSSFYQSKYRTLIHITLLLLLAFFLIPSKSFAETPGDKLVQTQIDSLEMDEVKLYWNKLNKDYGGFLPESHKGSILEFLQSEKDFSLKEWFLGLLQYLFHELLANGKLLGLLIILTVFSTLLHTIQNAFEYHAVSKVAYAIVYMVLVVIALNSFHVAMSYANEAVSNMMGFMIALIPLLLALMAAMGGVASVAFFHPIIIFLVNTSGLLIQHVVLPLLFLSALLSIVSTMTEHYKVTQLAKLLRNVSIGILVIFFTIFLGVISVQGATSAIADGLAIRTAKFITGNFIPIVGRMFTDAADTVMSASLLLKNTVGMAGVLILILLCAFPAIKVLSLAIIYNIAAAILQPLGSGPIIESLGVISKSVMYIFAALAIISFMFFLAITMIIAAGNISIMMR